MEPEIEPKVKAHHFNAMDLFLGTDVDWANRDSLISPQSAFMGTVPFEEEEEDAEVKEEKEEILLDMNTKLERALAENKNLIFKLYRRAGVIEEIKDSYLRDIITMKTVMTEHLKKVGAEEVVALWKDAIPSIDLSKSLALHAPTLSELKVKPCRTCGGSLDIEFHDSEKYNRIYAKVVKISGRNEELRLALATQATQYDNIQSKVNVQHQEHERVKKFLYEEIKETKEKLAEAQEKVTLTEANMKHVHHESMQIKKSNAMLVQNVKDHQVLETRAEESEGLVEKLRTQLDKAQELNAYLDKQILEKDAKVELLQKSGHQSAESLHGLKANLDSTKLALSMAIDETDSLKAKTARDAKDIQTFQLMIAPLNDEIRNLKHEHAIDNETQEQLTDSLRADLRALETQYTQLKREVPRITDEMMNLQRTVEELQDVVQEKDDLLDRAATKETNLQQELYNLHQVNDEMVKDLAARRDKELRSKYSSGSSSAGGSAGGSVGGGGLGAMSRLSMSIDEHEEPMSSFFNLEPSADLTTQRPVGESGIGSEVRSVEDGSVDDVNVGSGTRQRYALADDQTANDEYSDVAGDGVVRKGVTRLKTGELAVETGVGIKFIKSQKARKAKKKSKSVIDLEGGAPTGATVSFEEEEEEEEEEDDGDEDEEKTTGDKAGGLAVDIASPGSMSSPGASAADQGNYSVKKYEVKPRAGAGARRTPQSRGSRAASGNGGGRSSGGDDSDDLEHMAELAASKFSRPGPMTSYAPNSGTRSSRMAPQRNASVARRTSGMGTPGGFRPQENVDLVDVREGATNEEVSMREAILCTLTATVGPIPAKKAINALTPVLTLYGTLLSDAMAGMWDAMVVNKKASDYFCKTQIIMERMLSCTTENGITSYEIGKTCQDCIPLAMTSVGGGGLVNSWHELTEINSHVVQDLSGMINYQTGEVSFKEFSDFFGQDEDHLPMQMEAASTAAAKMGLYTDESLKALNASMIALLKDWNEAKSTFVDIDSIVEEEKKIVRQEADREINTIIAELSNTFARLEVAKEAVKDGTKKVEVQQSELGTLRPLPAKLETSEQKVRDLLGKIKVITAEAEEDMVAHKELKTHVVKLDKKIETQHKVLKEIKHVEEELRDSIVVLEETVVRTETHKTEVTAALDKVNNENFNRLHALSHVYIQTVPFHANASIQTEFICPPMSLRTAAKLTNNAKSTHYPLVFASFPEESRGSTVPALVTAAGASELPMSVDINEVISSEASVFGRNSTTNPVAGSKTLQKFRDIGTMSNPITAAEEVRALSASASTLRKRASPTGRKSPGLMTDGEDDDQGFGDSDTQTHRLPDFSDDLVDDVSLITAGTAAAAVGELDCLAVVPRDGNSSLVIKPASANSIHQFRDFMGIIPTDPDIASLVGQKVAASIVSKSLDGGFAPGSVSMEHVWNSSSQESVQTSAQEAWLKAATATGKPLDSVVSTFKVGSAARRGKPKSNPKPPRARVDSASSTANKYVTAVAEKEAMSVSSSAFNLPTLSAYGLSMNNSQNPIFSNRPSTGPATNSVGTGTNMKRSVHSQGNSRIMK